MCASAPLVFSLRNFYVGSLARKSKVKQKGTQANLTMEKGKGPSDSQAKKVRLVNEVMGIEELDIEEDEVEEVMEEILSPRSSLKSLQQQSMVRNNFSDWLETIKKSGEKIDTD